MIFELQDGKEEIFIIIKRRSTMERHMKSYCERNKLNPDFVDFYFNGRVIRPEETPHDVNLHIKNLSFV